MTRETSPGHPTLLGGLVDRRLHLAGHGDNRGMKTLTVIGAIHGNGDSIDDTAVLWTRTAGVLEHIGRVVTGRTTTP